MQIYSKKNFLISSSFLLATFVGQMLFSEAKAVTKEELLSKVNEAGAKCQEMQRDITPDVLAHLWEHNTGTPACKSNIIVCTKLGIAKRKFTFDMYKTRYEKHESLVKAFTVGRINSEIEMNNMIMKSPNVNSDLERNVSEKIQKLEKYCEAQVLVIQGPEFANILNLYNTLYGKK